MKKILNIIKKIVYAFLTIYSFDIILYKADVVIPINLYTIGITSIIGIPAIVLFTVLYRLL